MSSDCILHLSLIHILNQNFDSNESFLSYKLNILKDLYKSECEQKKDASQRITRIIPLIVAMFGADAYVIINTGNSILRNKEFSISIQSIISVSYTHLDVYKRQHLQSYY